MGGFVYIAFFLYLSLQECNLCIFKLSIKMTFSKMSEESNLLSTKSQELIKERFKAEDIKRVKWSKDWLWYVDILREREKLVTEYKKSSPRALAAGTFGKPDKRSVLPYPETTSGEIGWLSTRKEFNLEIFGSYYEKLVAPDSSTSVFYSHTLSDE